ncbi:hypothetical protein HIM_12329 [Hirsutella minnesotensis 3608]|uniref:Glucose receptor Git3-like N-terminal domain-containing protein n=1 Tax=Hirsutella minnesotensis 3608 TaxID=1043627 RepID=A0A0F7ZI59_9HYPO|nr:hypothetical protein HIM_12329 [Hirsutella minnesotensis 3608]
MASLSGSIDLVVAVPTFIGSFLSFMATSVAMMLHVLSPPKRHFRHALIINLLVADWINSLNNTISGAIALAKGHKDESEKPDAACIANAWIGQLSVQAVDFNILIISIVVLYTVLSNRLISGASTTAMVSICIAAWVPGIITSFAGLGLGVYGHVSGNWCWIRPEFLGIRYGLTHGWRIAIFVATIGIYTFVYLYLKRVFGRFRVSSASTGATSTSEAIFVDHGTEATDTQHILVSNSFAISHELEERAPRSDSHPSLALETGPNSNATFWSVEAENRVRAEHGMSVKSPQSIAKNAEPATAATKTPAPPNIKKMLLMNGYPIAYILLWIPGMANRIAESVGGSPRWLQALQSTTQLVGFVNAFTYGFSERLQRTHRRWNRQRGFART